MGTEKSRLDKKHTELLNRYKTEHESEKHKLINLREKSKALLAENKKIEIAFLRLHKEQQAALLNPSASVNQYISVQKTAFKRKGYER